jgi:WD40 repeat protein
MARYSADGNRLASAGDDLVVRIWDLATRQTQHQLSGHEQTIDAIAFSPDGKIDLQTQLRTKDQLEQSGPAALSRRNERPE